MVLDNLTLSAERANQARQLAQIVASEEMRTLFQDVAQQYERLAAASTAPSERPAGRA
jgi:hypothetical protein